MANSADQVAENILRISVPIPFPLRTVNIYALIGRDGWWLFDAAIGTAEARAAVDAGLASAGLKIEALRGIVLSHAHPDHIGLSGEFQERSGAPVYMHAIDEAFLQQGWNNERVRVFAVANQFLKPHGMPSDIMQPSQIPTESLRQLI